jgi:hypothetical protein
LRRFTTTAGGGGKRYIEATVTAPFLTDIKGRAMTIEADLASIKINLGRIAEALEALVNSQGIVPDVVQLEDPIPDEQGQLDLESEEAPPAKKKVSKKKKGKKKDKVVGKTDDEKPEYSLKDIRGLLHRLQEQENQAAVKSMLKKFSASTLGQVDEKKYAQLAEAITEALDDE